KDAKTIPDDVKNFGNLMDWAPALNAYFDKFDTLRLHSYFLTSLIYKGKSYGETNPDVWEECAARALKIWDAFKKAILPALLDRSEEVVEQTFNP
ncbi:hypothetical protein PMAYCL1PPCAC_10471, partial [Pristionchus mayeri]